MAGKSGVKVRLDAEAALRFHFQYGVAVARGNSSARAIRNPALRASKLAYASGLLIIGRSAHNILCVFVHASMTSTHNMLWLNCYII